MLQQTNRMSLVDQAAMQIEKLIETGVWQVGTKIPPEPELMEQLQVSRNTLREAVRALTHAGMLRTRQGDGTYVCSASALGPALQKRVRKTDALHTLEVRHALEREAAALAAWRRTDEDLQQLRRCLEECKLAVRSGDNDAYAEWDMLFHRAVVAASGNGLLMELYEHMTEGLRETVSTVVEISDHACFLDLHELLLQAVERRDEQQATAAVHGYIEQSKKHLL
ncbi:FadR/GntR family transcriptional regulator [Paenibacillus thailandensis]|uniref:FadR/GntR family transcriptional regulator n=1 Tax=Paenibacillus thailandensis TaxID=393250 RepID=A0ABW5QU29_9BACL